MSAFSASDCRRLLEVTRPATSVREHPPFRETRRTVFRECHTASPGIYREKLHLRMFGAALLFLLLGVVTVILKNYV